MKRTTSYLLIMVLVASLLIAGCAPKPVAEKAYEITVGCFMPAGSHISLNAMVPWIEALEKNSGGRIDVDFYPGGVFGKTKTAFEYVSKGMTDVEFVTFGYLTDIYPLSMVTQLPYGMTKDAVEGTKVIRELWDEYIGPDVEKDVHVCGFAASDLYALYTKKQITKMEDIKGMKLRTSGGLPKATVELFGATRVSIPAREMYEAIQRGTIDGGTHYFSSGADYKLWEVADYAYETRLPGSIIAIFMNKDTYNNFPDDLKKVVDDLYDDWSWWMAESYRDQGLTGRKKFEEHGVKIYTPTAEELAALREKTKPIWDKWEADMNAKGLPGTEMLKAYKAALAKHGM